MEAEYRFIVGEGIRYENRIRSIELIVAEVAVLEFVVIRDELSDDSSTCLLGCYGTLAKIVVAHIEYFELLVRF